MTEQKLLNALALTKIPGLGIVGIKKLLDAMEDAESIFRHRKELAEIVPGVGERLMKALDCPEAFLYAEKELKFIQKNSIACLSLKDEAYPSRLRECDDAPSLLFFKGNADLNALRVVSIVGTRHITDYGNCLCRQFIADLQALCPNVLIVSGLAYGVDIHAHREALSNELPTVGVLAHGLDRIYPSTHRDTAVRMLERGGLLTEYMSETNPDRQNFIQRNRIVAGMSDATIVMESAAKGGALITAELAQGYNRDCFAFAGRTTDEFSRGCNNLIRDNKAILLQSAEEFVKAMCWDVDSTQKPEVVQRQLFPDLTMEEQRVVDMLQEQGSLHINTLAVDMDIPVNQMNVLLFELEMKGVIRVLAGGMYRLLG